MLRNIELKENTKQRLHNGKYLVCSIVLSALLMCVCVGCGDDSIPVAGDEQQSTTVESTTEESTTPEQTTEEPTTEEPTTEEPTTEPPTVSGPNYIYEQLGDDTTQILTAGNVDTSDEELAALLEALTACEYRVSFKAVSIDGSKAMSYNSEEKYFPASAIKAPYLLYCYQQIDAGNGTFEEEMIYTSKYFYDGTGDVKNSEEGTVYTLHELMRRIIWNSDNSAYKMCAERWGKEGYNQLMQEIGAEQLMFPSYSIWAHDTRVGDFVIAWKSIYDYFQTETEGAKAFYDSTTNCKWNFYGGGIKNCTIAQKYGWAEEAFSNAGIIYGENETYLLVVFTDSEGVDANKREYANIVSKIHQIMDRNSSDEANEDESVDTEGTDKDSTDNGSTDSTEKENVDEETT